ALRTEIIHTGDDQAHLNSFSQSGAILLALRPEYVSMECRRFHLHDHAMGCQHGGIARWQRHFAHAGTGTGEALDGRLGMLLCLGISVVTKKVAQHAEAWWRVCLLHGQMVIAHRLCQGAGIMDVMPGNGLEHQRGVLYATHQDPNVVQTPTDRDHAVTADASIGRLEADDATVRRRSQGRATRLRAQRCWYHTGCHRSRRTTA